MEAWFRIGKLEVTSMSCGTGECGCGCEDLPLIQLETKEKEHSEAERVAVEAASECYEPVCGPTTCQ